jgi:SAM-dependent methyltransferase
MQEHSIALLACPKCSGELIIRSVASRNGLVIETGELACRECDSRFPIVRRIPRFVPIENYASGFGLEWTKHARTQYDSYTGLKLSATRFFEETQWDRDLSGQLVLEVGSGSGRFTEPAAATEATIISMDYSYAVEANYRSNGDKPNVLIVQGDVYHMPFRRAIFDKLFCFGMLQHTPDPRQAFITLPTMLKPGGELVVDVYKKTIFSTVLATKYYMRFLSRNLDPEQLYWVTRKWVDIIWPLSTIIRKIPYIGHTINWRLLVADYSSWGLKGELLKEWAYLDTFDMVSPRYDYPQTIATVQRWFEESSLVEIDVQYGYNGIEGRGKTPKNAGIH